MNSEGEWSWVDGTTFNITGTTRQPSSCMSIRTLRPALHSSLPIPSLPHVFLPSPHPFPLPTTNPSPAQLSLSQSHTFFPHPIPTFSSSPPPPHQYYLLPTQYYIWSKMFAYSKITNANWSTLPIDSYKTYTISSIKMEY